MAYDTYSGLKGEIASWLERDDLTAQIPGFIVLAEARFNREVRSFDMDKIASSPVAGESLSLPADFIEMTAVWLDGTPDRVLEFFPPQNLKAVKASGMAGIAQGYTIVGRSLYLAPTPSSGTIGMQYTSKIPALSDAAPTNWLLTAHPDLYLAASLAVAAQFTFDGEKAANWDNLAGGLIETINQASIASAVGATPTMRAQVSV